MIQNDKVREREFRSIRVFAASFKKLQGFLGIADSLNKIVETRFLQGDADQIDVLTTIINYENGSFGHDHKSFAATSTALRIARRELLPCEMITTPFTPSSGAPPYSA